MTLRESPIEEAAVKNCFVLRVASDLPATKIRRFRDPLYLRIAGKIVGELRVRGFQVTEPKAGKACDAAFTVKFRRFRIEVVMLATRYPGAIEGGILTWYRKLPFLPVSWQFIHDEWAKLVDAIDCNLPEDPTVTALSRLTFHEFEGAGAS
jgi:hypothetical protein